LRVLVVDPPFFTLPYDRHFCQALAAAGAEVALVGRPLRAFEATPAEPCPLHPWFYRRAEGGEGWRTSRATKLLKAGEHALGWRAVERHVADARPDVVHLQWLVLPAVDGFFLRRIARRAGLVLTVHNASLMAHSAASLVGGLAARLQRLGQGDILPLFDRFLAHTQPTRAHLVGLGVDPARILVLDHPPLGLDSPAPPAAEGRGEAPSKGEDVRILFFGSIKPYKGVDVLVRAGIALLRELPGCRIDIVGRPFQDLAAEQALVAAAGLQDRFGFDLRYVPDGDLAGYLARADVAVFPYREIDASGALALAVAHGLPVVASAIGVFKEPPAAEHIRLVPPDDPDALAAALRDLVRDPAARVRLAEGSRRLQTSLVSWGGFARSCLDLYRDIPKRD
jgi:glycosyltransferase involved in cell wall biosynthesis